MIGDTKKLLKKIEVATLKIDWASKNVSKCWKLKIVWIWSKFHPFVLRTIDEETKDWLTLPRLTKAKKVFVKFYFCKSILSGFLLKRILEISTAWTISWFIEFELHRASKVQVKSHFEFLILLFFEFELCLGAQVFRICALICNFFWLVSKCSFPNIRIIVFKFNSIWYSISETC